jgi:hypothetical protein
MVITRAWEEDMREECIERVSLIVIKVQFVCFFVYFGGFFHCCAGWGHIVAFIKVLTIYQLYLLEFTPSTILLYFPLPHSYNSSTGNA